MAKFTLILGNKNYSSWSLRPWLALSQTGAAFDEIVIPLWLPGAREEILSHSPAGKVPILRHGSALGNNVIWESLAICEYLAECLPDSGLWPEDPALRAVARAVSHEMHGGFMAVRRAMPMNCRASRPGKGMADGVADDIARITAIWRDCRDRFGSGGDGGGDGGGDFLFGGFTIADAMFAPMVSRFATYGVQTDPVSDRYRDAVLDLPAMRKWMEDARAEPWTVEKFEI